jgi:hypothetical protein
MINNLKFKIEKMKTINVEISEWHLAMLESMEKTTEHSRQTLLESAIVKMHSDLLNKINEGQQLEREGKAYLKELNSYNIDNKKGSDLKYSNTTVNKSSPAICFGKPDKDYWSRDHSLPYYPEECIKS